MKITLYTKLDCSLCDSLKADLLAIQSEVGFTLLAVDIEQDLEHFDASNAAKIKRYQNLLPVLDIDEGEILYSPFSYDELFDAIDRAVDRSQRR